MLNLYRKFHLEKTTMVVNNTDENPSFLISGGVVESQKQEGCSRVELCL